MAKQYFKSLYFSDYPTGGKAITLAFSEPEAPYYGKVKGFSSEEIREIIGINSYKQLELFARKEERSVNQVAKRLIKKHINGIEKIRSRDITFTGSKIVPFQRWYPYIEGYSPDYIKALITNYSLESCKTIYDPFVGTGTTIFAAAPLGIKTIYSEVNPLLQFLIQAKLSILHSDGPVRQRLAAQLRQVAGQIFSSIKSFEEDKRLRQSYHALFGNSIYFDERVYLDILRLRSYIDAIKLKNRFLADAITVAVLSGLIPVSRLKKAGDVRFKTKKELEKEHTELSEFLPAKLIEMAEDIMRMDYALALAPEFVVANAKNIDLANDLVIDAVITSPPYLNGTNYFRNTKLELWFLRYIQFKNDLRHFRDQALTSGINDVKLKSVSDNKNETINKSELLKNTLLLLDKHAYDQRIPEMARNYFEDMDDVFLKLATHLTDQSKVLVDIGDSIFAGVHIATDEILTEILRKSEYTFLEKKLLRRRRSRNKQVLSQSLLVFERNKPTDKRKRSSNTFFQAEVWQDFKNRLPHQELPYSKRNWGHGLHSLCSYQGKLKPAIAHHLVKTFIPDGGKVLDPFCGVGTIPFEAALNGTKSYGIDISAPAYYISSAKVSIHTRDACFNYIKRLRCFIQYNQCSECEVSEAKKFGFNKTLSEYYEDKTLREIILARRFFKENYPKNSSEMLVISALLHILHGNRPYALSRQSHPIVPYAPHGEFIYKDLIKNLTAKVNRSLDKELPINFTPGKIFNQDTTAVWPREINDVDAVVTSPPFFGSTRFYLANWLRIWFTGWSEDDFRYQVNSFIEEKQKKDFAVYKTIFQQARERLKRDGVCVFHLGKSVKCDMASELKKVSRRWFRTADLFDENVAHCESHGIRDKGTVTSHQYLVLV